MKGNDTELICDISGISRDIGLDGKFWKDTLVEGMRMEGANVLTSKAFPLPPTGSNSPPGIVAMVLIDMSFGYVHTFADDGIARLNIYTCGDIDGEEVWKFMVKCLDFGQDFDRPAEFRVRIVERGE